MTQPVYQILKGEDQFVPKPSSNRVVAGTPFGCHRFIRKVHRTLVLLGYDCLREKLPVLGNPHTKSNPVQKRNARCALGTVTGFSLSDVQLPVTEKC